MEHVGEQVVGEKIAMAPVGSLEAEKDTDCRVISARATAFSRRPPLGGPWSASAALHRAPSHPDSEARSRLSASPGRADWSPARASPGDTAEVGHEVHHSQAYCPGCSQPMVPTGAGKTPYVEELVPARRRVVAHRLYGYFCPGCAQEGFAPLPAELGRPPSWTPACMPWWGRGIISTG